MYYTGYLDIDYVGVRRCIELVRACIILLCMADCRQALSSWRRVCVCVRVRVRVAGSAGGCLWARRAASGSAACD